MRGAQGLGHRPFGGRQTHCLLSRLQGFEVGIDRRSPVGKVILELHLERFGRAPHRQLESVREMERVVHGAHRGELDGAATQPFEDSSGWLIATERSAVVKAHVPREAFPRERVRQPADLLGLLEQQDLVIHACKRGCCGHAAHAGPDDDDVEFVPLAHAAPRCGDSNIVVTPQANARALPGLPSDRGCRPYVIQSHPRRRRRVVVRCSAATGASADAVARPSRFGDLW